MILFKSNTRTCRHNFFLMQHNGVNHFDFEFIIFASHNINSFIPDFLKLTIPILHGLKGT